MIAAASTRARHWPVSWAKGSQFITLASLKLHFKIVLTFTLGTFEWLLLLRLFGETVLIFIACLHIMQASHCIWFYHPCNIWCSVTCRVWTPTTSLCTTPVAIRLLVANINNGTVNLCLSLKVNILQVAHCSVRDVEWHVTCHCTPSRNLTRAKKKMD